MLDANQSVSVFLKSLPRSIDGAMAMYLSVFSIALILLHGIILLTGFTPSLEMLQWNTLWDVLLISVPFMCLASYAWLNMANDYGRLGQLVNAILLSIFPGGIILKSLHIF
ncbi:MAG: hypothetical protein PHQ60_10675 [Sideroxydans sp.]|nr:hypothetical protein [Sideroxydans sp.]